VNQLSKRGTGDTKAQGPKYDQNYKNGPEHKFFSFYREFELAMDEGLFSSPSLAALVKNRKNTIALISTNAPIDHNAQCTPRKALASSTGTTTSSPCV
jgi:hypothetical protein